MRDDHTEPMRRTFVLRGRHTAVTPLHVTVPAAGGGDDGGGGGGRKKNPPSFMAQMTRYVGATPQTVYYVPGSSDRGVLRRNCARHISDRIGPMRFGDVLFNYVGAVRGKGREGTTKVLQEEEWRAANPQVSLFGAGDPFIAGKVRIGNMMCTEPIAGRGNPGAETAAPGMSRNFIVGVRRNPIKDGDYPADRLLDSETVTKSIRLTAERAPLAKLNAKIDPMRRRMKDNNRSEISKKIQEMIDEHNETIADEKQKITSAEHLTSEINRINKELAGIGVSSVSTQLPLPGFEVIPVGAVMEQLVFLDGVTDAELGLFLQGLADAGLRPFIGGHRNTNCGVISRGYVVSELKGDRYIEIATITVPEFGEIRIEPSGENGDDGAESLKTARKRWQEADLSQYNFKAVRSPKSDEEEDEGDDG